MRYKGSRGWLCGVIDHDEQHIQSTECLGNGFVVIVGVSSAFDILRWVAGLARKKKGGSGTRMGWVFGFIHLCWWLCGVIDHTEQHIQSRACLSNGFMVYGGSDL